MEKHCGENSLYRTAMDRTDKAMDRTDKAMVRTDMGNSAMERTDIIFIIYVRVSESFTLGVCYGMMENPESECEVRSVKNAEYLGLFNFPQFLKILS